LRVFVRSFVGEFFAGKFIVRKLVVEKSVRNFVWEFSWNFAA